MGLVLDTFASGCRGKPHHVFGNRKIAAMVDANFGNHKRGVIGGYGAMGDLHFELRGGMFCPPFSQPNGVDASDWSQER